MFSKPFTNFLIRSKSFYIPQFTLNLCDNKLVQNSQTNPYDIRQTSDKPDIEKLSGLFSDAENNLKAIYDYSEKMHDARFCSWDGQAQDGRKHGTDKAPAFPWEGASDLRTFNIDDITNKLSAIAMHAYSNARIVASCADNADPVAAGAAEQFMDWYLKKAIPTARRNLKLLSQWSISLGVAAMGVYWEEKHTAVDVQISAETAALAGGNVATFLVGQNELDGEILLPAEAIVEFADAYDLTEKQAEEALVSLATTGFCTIKKQKLLYSRARLKALRVGRDIFFPRGLENIQDSPFVFTVEYLTPNQLRTRADAESWHKDFLNEALETTSIRIPESKNSASKGVSGENNLENRVRIVNAYYNSYDAKGSQVLRMCVFSPDVKSSYATSSVLPINKYPFAICPFEETEADIVDSRGTAEIAYGWQREIKTQKDLRIDNAAISINPPKLFKVGNQPATAFAPGAMIPVRSGDFKIIEPLRVGQDPSVSIEIEKSVIGDMFAYFGNPTANEPTAMQNMQVQEFIASWLSVVSEIADIVFGYCRVYRTDAYRFVPVDAAAAEVADFNPADATDMNFTLSFDARDINMKDFLEKFEIVAKLALPLDKTGDINTAPMLRKLIGRLFPNEVQNLITSPTDSYRREVLETQQDLSAIFALQPVNAPEHCNAQLRLQMINEYAQKPGIASRMQVDPAFADALQTYVKQLQFQLQQNENAVIGRLGAKPADGMPASEQNF